MNSIQKSETDLLPSRFSYTRHLSFGVFDATTKKYKEDKNQVIEDINICTPFLK